MWYPISKLVLTLSKRRLFNQNQSLTTIAIISYIFFQTITFLVMYYALDSLFSSSLTFQTLSKVTPWAGTLIYAVSLYIIYTVSFKIPKIFTTLPYPGHTIYQAFQLPTLAGVGLLWISQIGVYLPVFLHLESGILLPFITYIFFSLSYTVLAGFSFNLILSLNKMIATHSMYVQLGMIMIMILLVGLYHTAWTSEQLEWNPTLWFAKAIEGSTMYLVTLILLFLIALVLLNHSFRYITLPEPKSEGTIKSRKFTTSMMKNGMLFTLISFKRNKERNKSVMSSFLVGLVLIVGLSLIFNIQEYIYFYFFVMVLGLGVAHVSVYNSGEEKILVNYSIPYSHLLLGKVVVTSSISLVLLAIAISLATFVGYNLSFTEVAVLFSAVLLFVSVASFLRLLFQKHGVVGETAYSMIAMIGFSILLFLEYSFLPRFFLLEGWLLEVIIALINILLAVIFFKIYMLLYIKRLSRGGMAHAIN